MPEGYNKYFSEKVVKEANKEVLTETINTAAKCVEKNTEGETTLIDDTKKHISKFINPQPNVMHAKAMRSASHKAGEKQREFGRQCVPLVIEHIEGAARYGLRKTEIDVQPITWEWNERARQHGLHAICGYNYYDIRNNEAKMNVLLKNCAMGIGEVLEKNGYDIGLSIQTKKGGHYEGDRFILTISWDRDDLLD